MISNAYWLSLSRENRTKLAQAFGLIQSSYVHVQGNEVLSDGYTPRDLSVLTVEVMHEYLKEKGYECMSTEFYTVLEAVIDSFIIKPSVETEFIKKTVKSAKK